MSNEAEFKTDFTQKAKTIILENVSDEQFGVAELADKMHISRSSLLRRIKKQTELSASQFIRKVRLEKAMDLLQQEDLNISELSYEVGFGNTSYFIKCFRQEYGYSPGEVRKGISTDENKQLGTPLLKQYKLPIIAVVVLFALGIVLLLSDFTKQSTEQNIQQKSIAVLPFTNQSSDSLNLYFVNGLMETTLNNLQKIAELRVVSRTSVAKYSDSQKGIPEIAEELNVKYLVEGSGQRVGNKVLLHIQLIEAASDTPIWSEQYNREIRDVFALQNEVAKKIAAAIEVLVTPAELQQIEKKPTNNLEAYDYYLQALSAFGESTKEGLEKAIPLFKKAIELDEQFALAYAKLAVSYFFLDLNRTQKQYTTEINKNADKALLYDSKSAESLISKALYYMSKREFNLALPHLEKALEYNPNSSTVIQILADLYARVIPNTSKYLQYALKGIQLDIASNDSVGKSYIYLHLSNALIQNGFTNKALKYIQLSLDYNPGNDYSPLVKIFIEYAQDENITQTTHLLKKEWQKDTTRLDLLQEVAKFYYFQEKYDTAYYYYNNFVKQRNTRGLNIYSHESLKMGMTYEKMGYTKQATSFYETYARYCENDDSIYKPLSTAVWYTHQGKINEAIEQLKIFASGNDYQYWILLFMDKDPLVKPLMQHPEFEPTMQKIRNRFWENQALLKRGLEEKGLL